jgi:predicted RNase H-like HicB family nuclease
VFIEKDDSGYYAYCPELKGCQSQGDTFDETILNIREAIELYLENLPEKVRSGNRKCYVIDYIIPYYLFSVNLG